MVTSLPIAKVFTKMPDWLWKLNLLKSHVPICFASYMICLCYNYLAGDAYTQRPMSVAVDPLYEDTPVIRTPL